MKTPIAVRSGAMELREFYQAYALRGLGVAVLAHLAILGCYYLASSFERDEIIGKTVIVTINSIPQPPSIKNTEVPPAITIAAPFGGAEKSANPIMVPDAEVSSEVTMTDQKHMNELPSDVNTQIGEGGNLVVTVPETVEVDKEPDPFTAVEKYPVPIVNVPPTYPEIARRAGLEGTVWVRLWVTKEGKPKKAEVLKSDSDIFNQAAMDAAMKWVFTPAVMNSGPVSVWISIPFKFKMSGGR